jgi:hypothetical protein
MGKAVALATFLLLPFVHSHAMADFMHGRDAFLEGRFQKAFTIFQSAAQTGDAKSQIGLGLMLTWGKGTARNVFEAYQWFDRVATCSEPIHAVIRILARTNRDFLADRMTAKARVDAETIAALRSLQDNDMPDSEAETPTVVISQTAQPARLDATVQPTLTTLVTVE